MTELPDMNPPLTREEWSRALRATYYVPGYTEEQKRLRAAIAAWEKQKDWAAAGVLQRDLAHLSNMLWAERAVELVKRNRASAVVDAAARRAHQLAVYAGRALAALDSEGDSE